MSNESNPWTQITTYPPRGESPVIFDQISWNEASILLGKHLEINVDRINYYIRLLGLRSRVYLLNQNQSKVRDVNSEPDTTNSDGSSAVTRSHERTNISSNKTRASLSPDFQTAYIHISFQELYEELQNYYPHKNHDFIMAQYAKRVDKEVRNGLNGVYRESFSNPYVLVNTFAEFISILFSSFNAFFIYLLMRKLADNFNTNFENIDYIVPAIIYFFYQIDNKIRLSNKNKYYSEYLDEEILNKNYAFILFSENIHKNITLPLLTYPIRKRKVIRARSDNE